VVSVSRIYRLLRLITMLQSGRSYTANELAGELEVSRRTVFRDLNVLELAHIPYYFDPKSRGYRISRHFFLPPVNLTLTEALAILLTTGRPGKGHRLPLLGQGARAAMKLQSVLPPAIRRQVGTLVNRLSVSLGPLASHEGLNAMFEELAQAIASRYVCRLVYVSFHERKQIIMNVHPLRLVFFGRAWYLIAYSTHHRQIRTFKLGRIRKLTVSQRTFSSPQKLDLEEYFGGAWGMIPEGKVYDVHLHFAPKVAGNIAEVQWHSTQRLEWNDDGSLEYHVRVNGLSEIAWWVLGYGETVEVIAPAALRKCVAKTASVVLQKYRMEGR